MKITLKAHIAEHREIAKMFGAFYSEKNKLFFYDFEGEKESISSWKREITIDTSSEMDLRMAIGTDIEFEENRLTEKYKAIGKCVGRITSYDKKQCTCISKWGATGCLNRDLQLSKDYLERIGVEVLDD